MISADAFYDVLSDHGVRFMTGVPCSYLSAPIARFTQEGCYVPAANEGAALAIAAGAVAAGTRAAVIAQNSGLGNLINPLTSLLMPYEIPALIFMSLRGWPDPRGDEPQHAVMGASTHALLSATGTAHWTLGADTDAKGLSGVLDETEKELSAGQCAFVLVEKGAVEVPVAAALPRDNMLTRAEALAAITASTAGLPVVSTTGYTSRELFASGDSPAYFYMQGSMGHASAFALGVALHVPAGSQVVVLDGDGAALMHLGTMSTIGALAPPGLIHIVMDNHAYDSTGAQRTTSASTDFAAVALGVGYASASHCHTPADIRAAIETARGAPGPHLLVVPISRVRCKPPPRATSAISATAIHHRFTAALGTHEPWGADQDFCSAPAQTAPADSGKLSNMGRPRTINRSAILQAAIDLADEKGLQSVTLKAVAGRLGVTAMSLYGYIDNKAALLDGIVEKLLSEFPLPDADLPWHERLSQIGRAARASARRHPDVFPLLLTRSAGTPGSQRVRQEVFSALLDAGLSINDVNRAERLLTTTIVGFAISEVSGRFGQSAATIEADYVFLEEILRNLITAVPSASDAASRGENNN